MQQQGQETNELQGPGQPSKRFTLKRLIIAISIFLIFGTGTIIGILSYGRVISHDWWSILTFILAVLAVAVPAFVWLFPISSNGHSHIIFHHAPSQHQQAPPAGEIAPLTEVENFPSTSSSHGGSVFLVNEPLQDPGEFFARVRERTTLISRTRNGASTSIVGPRRIGKTWLIEYLKLKASTELGSRFHIGYLDASSPSCSSVNGFTNRALEELSITALLPNLTNQGLSTLEAFVRGLKSKNWTPVLCIDEFEGFSNCQEFNIDFFKGLRALVHVGLVLVVASRRSLDDILEDCGETSPFFNVFLQLTLNPFGAEESEQFISAKGVQAGFSEQEQVNLLKYGQKSEQSWPPLRLQLAGKMLLEDKIAAGESKRYPHRPDMSNYWREFGKRVEKEYRRIVR